MHDVEIIPPTNYGGTITAIQFDLMDVRLTKEEKEVLWAISSGQDVRSLSKMEDLLITLRQLKAKGLADFVELDQKDVGFAGEPELTDNGRVLLKENPKLRNGLSEGTKWAIGIAVSILIALIAML